MFTYRQNSRVSWKIGIGEHDGDVRFLTGSRNKTVLRMRNEKYAIWPLVMAESPKLLHSSAMDLWTRLWGRYHVPQNVFLVCNNFSEILWSVARILCDIYNFVMIELTWLVCAVEQWNMLSGTWLYVIGNIVSRARSCGIQIETSSGVIGWLPVVNWWCWRWMRQRVENDAYQRAMTDALLYARRQKIDVDSSIYERDGQLNSFTVWVTDI